MSIHFPKPIDPSIRVFVPKKASSGKIDIGNRGIVLYRALESFPKPDLGKPITFTAKPSTRIGIPAASVALGGLRISKTTPPFPSDISPREKTIEERLEALFNTIPTLHPTATKEQPDKFFEIENQLRGLLTKDFPHKGKYQNLYEREVIPLLQQAKRLITERPIHFAVQAAAAKGKAVQAGVGAINNLIAQDKTVIQSSGISTQEVFLVPKEKVVFKHSSARAKEEETIVNSLFDLMSKQAIVGTFSIRIPSLKPFGIQLSPELTKGGFKAEDLSSTQLRQILPKLTSIEQSLLNLYQAKLAITRPALVNYQSMATERWLIQLPGESAEKTVSLKELQALYLADKLPPETLIGSSSQAAIPLSQHLLFETSFSEALTYLPTLEDPASSIYVVPDLDLPDNKRAYELCEKFKWSYADTNGTTREADFKTLHALVLQRGMIPARPVLTPSAIAPSAEEMMLAFAVPWRLIIPETAQMKEGTLSKLSDLEAKPFISDMILMTNLSLAAREMALKRLTDKAQMNAVLMSELQLLDLHSGNLAITLFSNPDYEHFKNIQFSFPPSSTKKDFKILLINYLEGKIKPETMIKFEDGETIIEKPCRELPEIQRALDAKWEFVIFDTDLSLSEHNYLQEQVRRGAREHLIPLRSVLLETQWKNEPLSEEVVKNLIKSDERDLQVKKWISHEDAPIYKRLSPAVKTSLQAQLTPVIEKYQLSSFRKRDTNTTIATLRGHFIKEICNLSVPEYRDIWQTIERDLSSVPVKENDTWETLAKRHLQTIETLRRLNPEGLKVKGKINIKYDLTSSSASAVKKRQRIAAQFFPRLSTRQQAALLERQKNRKTYLDNYQSLKTTTLKGEDLWNQMEQFVLHPSTPFDTPNRENMLTQLRNHKQALLVHDSSLEMYRNAICVFCQPTYFNLTKSMYPLLADAHALNEIVYNDLAIAGRNIGRFQEPLEATIAKAKARCPAESIGLKLATELERQISTIRDPAFFGEWL